MDLTQLTPEQIADLKTKLGLVSPAEAAAVGAVSIKVPAIWKNNVCAWFKSLESQFSVKGITSSVTKYHHVLSVIEEDIHDALTSVIEEADAAQNAQKYDILKAGLLKLFGKTTCQKNLEAFSLTLDGLTVKQLNTKFSSLLTDIKSVRKTLLLRSLPADVGTVLAGLDLDSADDVAEKADIMLQHRVSKANMIQTATLVPGGDHDPAEVDSVRHKKTAALAKLPFVCRHHARYGPNAYSCKDGCLWASIPLAKRPGNANAGRM